MFAMGKGLENNETCYMFTNPSLLFIRIKTSLGQRNNGLFFYVHCVVLSILYVIKRHLTNIVEWHGNEIHTIVEL